MIRRPNRYGSMGNYMLAARGARYMANRYGSNVRRAIKVGWARSRSTTGTMTKSRRGTSGISVTNQHDARLVYRKKRMPWRMRRRYKRFSRKVNNVAEKDLGSQTRVFNTLLEPSNNTPGKQVVFGCTLYGLSSSDAFNNDLDTIGGDNANAITTGANGLNQSTKVIFHSAVLDMTVRNSSGQYDDVSNPPILTGPGQPMEVDVYELTCNRSDEESVTYNGLIDLFVQNPARTEPINSTGTKLQIDDRGVTPWDCTYSLSNFGIKILKKTKYQLAWNEQFTYQIRDPRRHVLGQRELTSSEGPSKRGLTRHIIILARLAPGYNVQFANNAYLERLSIGWTRKYFYKIENWTDDRSQIN